MTKKNKKGEYEKNKYHLSGLKRTGIMCNTFNCSCWKEFYKGLYNNLNKKLKKDYEKK